MRLKATIISQLIPTVRLISPILSCVVGTEPSRFTAGVTIGIALWNTLFNAAGYLVAMVLHDVNSSAFALKVLTLIVAAEVIIALGWRLRTRMIPEPGRFL